MRFIPLIVGADGGEDSVITLEVQGQEDRLDPRRGVQFIEAERVPVSWVPYHSGNSRRLVPGGGPQVIPWRRTER